MTRLAFTAAMALGLTAIPDDTHVTPKTRAELRIEAEREAHWKGLSDEGRAFRARQSEMKRRAKRVRIFYPRAGESIRVPYRRGMARV